MTATIDGPPTCGTYPPLCTLKAVTQDVWIVDGPEIFCGMRWARMPFPTRMTIIRLDGGNLFVHSPTPLTEKLRAQVAAVGSVRHRGAEPHPLLLDPRVAAIESGSREDDRVGSGASDPRPRALVRAGRRCGAAASVSLGARLAHVIVAGAF